MKTSTKIVLVEDHPRYRKVIEMALQAEADFELVNMFGAAEVALRNLEKALPTEHPDIILLDLNLPGMNGLEAIPYFKTATPKTKIIILTQSDKQEDVLQAIRLGASGYLLKSSTVGQIKDGIQTVTTGGASLDGKIAQYILGELKQQPAKLEIEKPLSDRELEILTLLAEGLVKKEIGDKLGIAYGSVATYIRRIYEKLNVLNAPAAVNKAHRLGLFE
ncbi:response regulator transcription factor [Pelagicoccus sp. SDUM812005]|uniref:response regulator transcription factor n=1 Tax=Pelagicoccus sp. SDUM812005 TaxID=3041257 RepID=UPI00281028A1|nr:response regulator transcription factor [Pelagicoccus sp. SDUM812005]MDQ8182946.1 response regulator transcription factor [Pelagicoccus sp. SDUM812005]